MVTLKDIDALISDVCPENLSESWDNDGFMLCKDKGKTVEKVLLTLDVTEECIDYAIRSGFEVIISHHPFIFSPLKKIYGYEYRLIEKLIQSDISVLSYHTRFDSAQTGVNSVLAETLGLKDVKSFGGESGCIGKIGVFDKSIDVNDFIMLLKERLGCGNIRASYNEGQIKKVAVVGGAGKSFWYDAYTSGADAYVTSEVPHNVFAEAKEHVFSIFDCGHYYTENPSVKRFKEIIDEKFESELETAIFDSGSPYKNV